MAKPEDELPDFEELNLPGDETAAEAESSTEEAEGPHIIDESELEPKAESEPEAEAEEDQEPEAQEEEESEAEEEAEAEEEEESETEEEEEEDEKEEKEEEEEPEAKEEEAEEKGEEAPEKVNPVAYPMLYTIAWILIVTGVGAAGYLSYLLYQATQGDVLLAIKLIMGLGILESIVVVVIAFLVWRSIIKDRGEKVLDTLKDAGLYEILVGLAFVALHIAVLCFLFELWAYQFDVGAERAWESAFVTPAVGVRAGQDATGRLTDHGPTPAPPSRSTA